MSIDEGRLTRLRRYENPGSGIYEEFAERRLGPGHALALLSGPLGSRRDQGWVICPTIGPEHGNLRRLEALAARTLAAAGFVGVRIRPDAHPLHREVDLPTRLAEIDEAVALLRGETGVEAVGLTGTLFGGTAAALVADRLGLPALALVQPVARGRQYARELLRREAVAQLMGPEDGAAAEGPMHELSTTGAASIRGLRLSQDAFDSISTVNLLEDLKGYSGRSLLVEISPSGAVSPGVRKLHERLVDLGGDVTLVTIPDPLYAPLGEYYYRDAGLVRIDTRLELDRKLADALTAWAVDETPARATASVA
jgi:hypothetical protein